MLLVGRGNSWEPTWAAHTQRIALPSRPCVPLVPSSCPPGVYEQIDLGLNYRMTDIQAAHGTSQMTRLDGFVARRHELAARYDALLAKLPLTHPWQHPDTNSAWHLYVIRLRRNEIKLSRRQVFDALRAAGIGVNRIHRPRSWRDDALYPAGQDCRRFHRHQRRRKARHRLVCRTAPRRHACLLHLCDRAAYPDA